MLVGCVLAGLPSVPVERASDQQAQESRYGGGKLHAFGNSFSVVMQVSVIAGYGNGYYGSGYGGTYGGGAGYYGAGAAAGYYGAGGAAYYGNTAGYHGYRPVSAPYYGGYY